LINRVELKEYWESLNAFGKFKFVAKIILVILTILFAVFNWQNIELHLIFVKVNVPLTVLILICFGIGLLISSIFDYRRFKVKNKEIEVLKKQIEDTDPQ
jgi:uncharacterized integral membrane protein